MDRQQVLKAGEFTAPEQRQLLDYIVSSGIGANLNADVDMFSSGNSGGLYGVTMRDLGVRDSKPEVTVYNNGVQTLAHELTHVAEMQKNERARSNLYETLAAITGMEFNPSAAGLTKGGQIIDIRGAVRDKANKAKSWPSKQVDNKGKDYIPAEEAVADLVGNIIAVQHFGLPPTKNIDTPELKALVNNPRGKYPFTDSLKEGNLGALRYVKDLLGIAPPLSTAERNAKRKK